MQEWEALLRRAFVGRWGGAYRRRGYFREYAVRDPYGSAGRIVGLFQGEQLVSTYQVFSRRVRVAGRSYRLEGVGNVATALEYQRRGFASMLMRAFLQARRAGRDFAIVYARDGAFYRRLGWRPFVRGMIRLPLSRFPSERLGPPVRHRSMRRDDLQAVSRMYSSFNRQEGLLHVVRTATYWERWVWEWKLNVYRLQAEIFIDGANRPIGYAFSRVVGDQLRVEEYGALAAKRDLVYRGLLQCSLQRDRIRTVLVMRPVPSFQRWLTSIGSGYSVEAGPDELGHVYAFRPSTARHFSSMALWHVDHF